MNYINEYLPTKNQEVDWIVIRKDDKHFPTIKDMSNEVASDQMTKLIVKAYMFMGKAANPKDLQFIATNVLETCRADKRLRKMKIQEISDAVIRAVTGRGVELYGEINVYRIMTAIVDYERNQIVERNSLLVNDETLKMLNIKN